VLAPVTVDHSLLHAQYSWENTATPGAAEFRVGDEPKSSDWYAEVEDDVLSITKEAAYEAAMWLPLLEKAYAKFQDQWGAYGEGKGENLDDGKRASMESRGFSEDQLDIGYELLHWGATAKIYPMFFGDAAGDWGYHETQTESGNADFVDPTLLETLLQQKGVGLEEGQELYLDTLANSHAYSVLGSDLRDHQNQPVDLTLQDASSRTSAQLSTVTVRNPYGQDSKDKFGTREKEHNGITVMSLDEFQRVFPLYGYSLVG